MSDWRTAKAIDQLLKQVNAAHPKRSKASDGTIGDAEHATRESDHNPWVGAPQDPTVTGVDITHDPLHGMDVGEMFAAMIKKRDKRIKYLIFNDMILSSTLVPWVWREYEGSNEHRKHGHLSLMPIKALYDSTTPWAISLPKPPAVKKVHFELWDDGKKVSQSIVVPEGKKELERLQAFLAKTDSGILKRLQDEGTKADVKIMRLEGK
jgi:hypothetical protein